MKTLNEIRILLRMREDYARLPRSFSPACIKRIDQKLEQRYEAVKHDQELPPLPGGDDV